MFDLGSAGCWIVVLPSLLACQKIKVKIKTQCLYIVFVKHNLYARTSSHQVTTKKLPIFRMGVK